ncbi:MAG: alpha/beta hydrolase-fold protein [Gemmatimonadales bacterium]
MWQRTQHSWESPSLLGRTMEMVVIGHAGARMLVFPTSMGSCTEWDDRRMPEMVGESIRQGLLQLYCVSTASDQGWYDDHAPMPQRAVWQDRYDQYLYREVLPFMKQQNDNPFLITAGASFGGYHALNFALRHPHEVGRVLAMSSMIDVKRLTYGWSDDLTYRHNPMDFMRYEHDPARLEAFRGMDIILAIGEDDPLCQSNREFSALLWQLGIGNALRIWKGWAHDWPYWEDMVRLYTAGHD